MWETGTKKVRPGKDEENNEAEGYYDVLIGFDA